MKVALDKFLTINGEWVYLSDLRTETQYIVLPDRYAHLSDMTQPEKDFITRSIRDEILNLGYEHDDTKMSSKLEGLTAIPLKEYDGYLDHFFPVEEATWH